MFNCKVLPSDKIAFGSGGSETMIVIRRGESSVFKLFPLIFPRTLPRAVAVKRELQQYKHEASVGLALAKHVKSSHFVASKSVQLCSNAQELFKKCGNLSLKTYLTTKRSKDEPQYCDWLWRDPSTLDDKYLALTMEYAGATLKDYLADVVAKLPAEDATARLDALFFQLAFTLEQTWKVFPFFIHGDLFIRNIMGVETHASTERNGYIRYHLGHQTFDVPNFGYMPKIADFGLTTLTRSDSKKHFGGQPLKNRTKDWFCILYDVYNGGNLGSQSLTSLLKPQRGHAPMWIKKYFDQFLDVATIDEISKHKKQYLDWVWDAPIEPEFVELVGLISTQDVLKNFAKKFPVFDDHIIDFEEGL